MELRMFFTRLVVSAVAVVCIGSGIACSAPLAQAQVSAANQAQIAQLLTILQGLQAQLAQLLAARASVTIGSSVRTTTMVNVRSSGSVSGSILGTQPFAATGMVVGGPVVSGGYTWWNINYATGVDGWSVGTFLTAVGGAVTAVSDDENPRVTGTAVPGSTVSFSVGGSSGDKIYGSGLIPVVNGAWSHTITTDLPNGTYTLKLAVNSTEVVSRPFTITDSTDTLPQVSWVEPSGSAVIDSRGDVRTIYLESTTRTEPEQYDTLLARFDRVFRMDDTAACTIVAWYEKAYRSITLKNTPTAHSYIGEYIPVTERYYNSDLTRVEVDCLSASDSFKKTLFVDTQVSDDPVELSVELTGDDTDSDDNDRDIVTDNAGEYTLTFEVTAENGALSIPMRVGNTDADAGFSYSVYTSSSDNVDVSYTETDSASHSLTSTARTSGSYYIIDNGETEEFTLTVLFDPVAAGSYRVRLDKIRYYANGLTSRLYTDTVSDEDIETDSLSISGTGIPANGPTGAYIGYLNDVVFTTQTVKETLAYEYCKTKAAANSGSPVYCTWNGRIVFDTRSVVTPLSKQALGVGVYRGFVASGTVATNTLPTGVVNVRVANTAGHAAKSLVLILSGYEPVRWRVSGAGIGAIGKVFATGYYNQTVTGLPADIPVVTTSFKNNNTAYFSAYSNSGAEYTKLKEYVEDTYDTTFQQFIGAQTKNQVVVTVE